MGESEKQPPAKKSRRNFIVAGILALGAAVAGLVLGRDYISPPQQQAQQAPPPPQQEAPQPQPAPAPAPQQPAPPPKPEVPKKFALDQIVGEAIKYPGEAGDILAYEARPQFDAQFPAMIIVHENTGLLEHFKDVARRYAMEGFVAVAVDFVSREGGSLGEDMARENQMKQARMTDAMVQSDIDSTIKHLKSRSYVKGNKIGITGFCWGGRQSMIAALRSKELAAGIPYYGNPVLARQSETQTINPISLVTDSTTPLLSHFGVTDRSIPTDTVVAQFRQALQDNNKTFEIHIYEGAGHAFFNDTRPSYNEVAAKLSWERNLAFLEKYLKS
ncbi:MAG: dienelactone hydrolase family protein [Thaumarchaeota archaeon]|nr:dienelactone hydrolase family protein [Nitrososphaerota archaeon]